MTPAEKATSNSYWTASSWRPWRKRTSPRPTSASTSAAAVTQQALMAPAQADTVETHNWLRGYRTFLQQAAPGAITVGEIFDGLEERIEAGMTGHG